MNLHSYFDRVVLINLKRRPDRFKRVQEALHECRWPFKWPELVEAVDGFEAAIPPHFTRGPGAWGCLRSHHQVLERAIADRVKSILILEDDVCFVENFRESVEQFLQLVPGDWEQLMIGGQHRHSAPRPDLIKPGVLRCFGCERTHCYAVRGEYLSRLIGRWTDGGTFNGNGHCDWIMGRDPDLQPKHRVFAPEFFLAGQERSLSDVNHRVTPRQFWNPPGPGLAVINLHAPAAVAAALCEYGFHFGYERVPPGDFDRGLRRAFAEPEPSAREQRLRKWIMARQWEVESDVRLICAIAHPQAEPKLVAAASPWPVYEVTAKSVRAALKQLPKELQHPRMPELLRERSVSEDHQDRAPLSGFGRPVPHETLVRSNPPSAGGLTANLTRALVGWAHAGFPVVDRPVFEHRHAICSACEHWQPRLRLGTGMCRKCGCSGAKLWLATSKCPDLPPRWGHSSALLKRPAAAAPAKPIDHPERSSPEPAFASVI
jgi:hypothetical protein